MHDHQFVFLGYLQDPDDGAGVPVVWCRDCGTPALRLKSERFAVLTPEWSSKRLEAEGEGRAALLQEAPVWSNPVRRRPKQATRLGRGLSTVRSESAKVTFATLKRLLKGAKRG